MNPFRWLTRVLTRAKQRETEIEEIKADITANVVRCRREAVLGDESSMIKLNSLSRTVAQQSERLLRAAKPPSPPSPPPIQARWIVLLLAAALSGCVTKSTTTEEDRQGVDVLRQINEANDADLTKIEGVADERMAGMAGAYIAAMRTRFNDTQSVIAQLQENNGPPERPVVYSHAEMPGLLDRIKKSHAVTWWLTALGWLGTGATVMLGIARSPLAKLIPGFGNIFGAFSSTVEAIEAYMQQKKAGGEVNDVRALAGILSAAHKDAGVKPLVDRWIVKAKDALGLPAGSTAQTPPPLLEVTPAEVVAEVKAEETARRLNPALNPTPEPIPPVPPGISG